MALYKKSSVEIPPIEKEKKAEEYRSRLGSEKDNEIIGEDDVITGELDKKAICKKCTLQMQTNQSIFTTSI